jgi:intracellular septation protein
MKILLDLLPVILFFVAYTAAKRVPDESASFIAGLLGAVGAGEGLDPAQAPILVATLVAVLATVAQVAWVLLRHGKVPKMLWMNLAIIVVLGAATLLLRDETFIKWKPTVVYWLFGGVIAGGQFLGRNVIRSMMGTQMNLPDPVWARLAWSFAAFFAAMGLLNLFVAYNFSTDAWVNFKLFGGIGLMFAFLIALRLVLARHLEDDQEQETR